MDNIFEDHRCSSDGASTRGCLGLMSAVGVSEPSSSINGVLLLGDGQERRPVSPPPTASHGRRAADCDAQGADRVVAASDPLNTVTHALIRHSVPVQRAVMGAARKAKRQNAQNKNNKIQ